MENKNEQNKKLIPKFQGEIKKFKGIPVPIGILLLLMVGFLVVFVRQRQIVFLGATSQLKPKDVKVSNITDKSFVVSWVTEAQTTGGVKLANQLSYLSYRDFRDSLAGQLGKYYTHYVLVDHQLEPSREYRFSIICGGTEFQDEKFVVKTAQPISGSLPQADLAFGQVKTEEGDPAPGAIVYLEIPNISLLSSLTTSQGNWVIPLSVAFDTQLSGIANIPENKTEERIRVEGGRLGRSVVSNLTDNNKPVPVIILGQNQDFREFTSSQEEEPEARSLFEESFSPTSIPVDFEIKNPQEGEAVNTLKPEIFGVGPAGGKIEIIVESEKTFKAEIEIGQDQKWRWAVPENLEPGEHTLTVNYISPTGEIEKIVRRFVVMAAEDNSSPAFVSTPSALIATPTVSPTPTSLPTPTLTPTATPTAFPREVMPSTESGVPVSGFGNLHIFLILIGSILLVSSYYLFHNSNADFSGIQKKGKTRLRQ